MVGRLRTLNVLPVMAGDSIEIDMQGIFKMNPFRRPLQTDVKADVVSFFVPHRHIYGSDWINFLKDGNSSGVTLSTLDPTVAGWNHWYAIPWLGNQPVPLWLIEGYVRIWNRYFRTERQGLAERTVATTTSSGSNARWGWLTASLPALWNVGHDSGSYPTNDTVASAASFELTALAQAAAEYETQLQREWTANYYSDVMKKFGGYATTDADQRPEVLGHSSKWLSGFDVYGTASGNLGEVAGRVETIVGHHVPRKLMPEHGTIWTVAVLRYPPSHEREMHAQVGRLGTTMDYANLTGDPTELEKRKPYDLERRDCFRDSTSTVSLGKIPAGQQWRYQPNIVDRRYDNKNGFPFFRDEPETLQEAVLYPSKKYSSGFASTEFGHWQYQVRNNVRCLRHIGGYGKSLFAGTEM